MDVPQDIIDKWQNVWMQLCDMAYSRKDVSSTFSVEKFNYNELLTYMINSKNFDLITLDHTWKQVSSQRNPDGTPVEPLVVAELYEIYVPHIMFASLGVFQWFKYSFPNCTILFWEDDM